MWDHNNDKYLYFRSNSILTLQIHYIIKCLFLLFFFPTPNDRRGWWKRPIGPFFFTKILVIIFTLVDDEISRKHLLNSREHLKNAVEQICPSWQKQLMDDGLYRIYNLSEGLGYYVSKFYFDQVREGKVAGYKIKD